MSRPRPSKGAEGQIGVLGTEVLEHDDWVGLRRVGDLDSLLGRGLADEVLVVGELAEADE